MSWSSIITVCYCLHVWSSQSHWGSLNQLAFTYTVTAIHTSEVRRYFFFWRKFSYLCTRPYLLVGHWTDWLDGSFRISTRKGFISPVRPVQLWVQLTPSPTVTGDDLPRDKTAETEADHLHTVPRSGVWRVQGHGRFNLQLLNKVKVSLCLTKHHAMKTY
jgi:hypothetical protein